MFKFTNQSQNGSEKIKHLSENKYMLEQFRQNLKVTLDVSNIQPNGFPEHLSAYNEAIKELLEKKEFS